MTRERKARRAVALAAVCALPLAATACYSTRLVHVESLQRLEEPVTARIGYGGEVLRVRVDPEMVKEDEIVCRPCAYEASSWRVRFSGWPAVYRSGRSWRNATTPESLTLETDKITSVRVERLDWPLTIISSPINLPAGLIDFLVTHAQIGFDAVNNRFDDFSPQPETAPAAR